jgi:two-component system, cell cycle sensor histidine kinase and response regulator CckA
MRAVRPAPDDGPVARLVVLEGPGRGRKYKIASEAIIGRSSTCNVIIDDAEISRRHARISCVEGGFRLEDLGSRNGTSVNGVPAERAELNIGDKIQLSDQVVLVLASFDPTGQEILQRQRLETLGRLAAGLAHDFNNMQAVITAGIDFVTAMTADNRPEAKVQDTLRDMMQASERASALARSLMSYARTDLDGFVTVDISAVCREVLGFSRRTFPKVVDVIDEIGDNLHVIASSAEMHQLLMNLCVNASDAMPTGGTLRVSAKIVPRTELTNMEPPAGDRVVVIEVSDDGAGMDETTRKRIFEPFFTTKSGTGFGLGLATVKEIVSSHGATMTVDSAPGEGTTFRVALPAAAPPRTRRAKSIPPGGLIFPKLPKDMTVLVADDQEIVRRTVNRILVGAGASVIEAADGQEAVAVYAACATRPDLVILDLDMPKATGEQALASLRELDPDVRVIVMSGHHEDERERAARALGVMGFLRKPFNAVTLVTASLAAMHGDIDVAEERTTLGRPKR